MLGLEHEDVDSFLILAAFKLWLFDWKNNIVGVSI